MILYGSKENLTFYSGSHKSWTCPEVSLVSSNIRHNCSRTVLPKLIRFFHCPVIISSEIKLQLSNLPKKRWNFRKADWPKFQELTHKLTYPLSDPFTSMTVNDSLHCFLLHVTSGGKTLPPQGQNTPVYSMLG